MSEPHTHAPSIADTFARKYGPLPGYAWGAIAVAAVVLFAYLRQRGVKGSTTSPNTINGVADPLGSDLSGNTTGSVQPASAATTNGQWGINAVNYLVGTGSNAIDASNAIYGYLNRRQLTYSQSVLVNRALSQLGPPPEGLLPIQAEPAPTSGSAPGPYPGNSLPALSPSTYFDASTGKWVNVDNNIPPPKVTAPDPVNPLLPPSGPAPGASEAYIAQPGDTYAKISQKFYGNTNHAARLADANNNQPVMPGLKVVL